MPNTITAPPSTLQLPVAEIAAAIEALIEAGRRMGVAQDAMITALDAATVDPDLEPAGDEEDGNGSEDDDMLHSEYNGIGCPVSDPDGPSTAEWTSLGRHKATVLTASLPHEDAELDDDDTGVEDHPQGFDPEVDCCLAGDDRVCSGAVIPGIYGDKYDGPGDADDAEREQLPDDVPCLAVYSLEPNIFTSKRVYLGRSNLKPSFVSGRPIKAAD